MINSILLESFNRVNKVHFNNEYKLIENTFINLFSAYEIVSPEDSGHLISSYYQFLKLYVLMLEEDVLYLNFLERKATNKSEGNVILGNIYNDISSFLSPFALIRTKNFLDLNTKDVFENLHYKVLKDMDQNEKLDYFKKISNECLIFLEVWQKDLGYSLVEKLETQINKNESYNICKTESGKKLVSHLYAIKKYSCEMLLRQYINDDKLSLILSKLIGVELSILLNDLKKEVFIRNFSSDIKKERVFYPTIVNVLEHIFSSSLLDALLSESPKKYLLENYLEEVENSNLNENLFNHVKSDISAINLGVKNQIGFKVLLHGNVGTGKTELSKLVAKTSGLPMYRLKMLSVQNKEKNEIAGGALVLQKLLTISHIFKNNDFLLLIDECEELFENNNQSKEQINYTLDKIEFPCIFIANDIKGFHPAYLRRFHYHLHVEVADYNQKLFIAKQYLDDMNLAHYIASKSVTNADLKDNIDFYKTTNNIDFLRQRIENKQITEDLLSNTIEKSIFDFVSPENNNHNFDAIIGQEHEKNALLDIKHYLDNKDMYDKAGVSISHGSILYGHPGTGKTSIVKALAKKCNVPLINVVTGFMQNDANGALTIKKVFNMAKRNQPCIVLLDEFEKMALHRNLEMKNGTSQSLMNQLLMEMDDIYNEKLDIFVFATCNTIDYIDPAISRSGRFEKTMEVDLPKADVREKMFKHLLGDFKIKNLKQVVQHTTGLSFVDLKFIVNNYKIALLKNENKVSNHSLLLKEIHNFSLGTKKTGHLRKDEKKLVAYHESGHAFLAYLFDHIVGNISIIPKSGYLGVTLTLNDEGKHIRSRQDIENEVMILMAGRASEQIFLQKETSGSGDDFNRATDLVLKNINLLAPDKVGLFHTNRSDYKEIFSQEYKSRIEKSVNDVLDSLYKKTHNILNESREEIEVMVSKLLKKEELVQNEMEGILKASMSARNVTKLSKINFANGTIT